MNRFLMYSREQGSVLLVTMVFLLIFGVVAASIFRGTQTSVQAIGNMQWRTEAIDVANLVIAEYLTVLPPIGNPPVAQPDPIRTALTGGVNQFTQTRGNMSVDVRITCDSVTEVDKASLNPAVPQDVACINSELIQGGSFCSDVNFSISALAIDPATGANVRVVQGASLRVIGTNVCN